MTSEADANYSVLVKEMRAVISKAAENLVNRETHQAKSKRPRLALPSESQQRASVDFCLGF